MPGREELHLLINDRRLYDDLRRTAASHMASMGIPRLVISKVLNHVERGITAVYDRHGYDREKRAALEAWAARLGRIITGRGGDAAAPFVNPWMAREGTSASEDLCRKADELRISGGRPLHPQCAGETRPRRRIMKYSI